MSIKGYLNEIKFVELLRLVAKSEGRLGIWNFGKSKQYECFIQNSQIIYLNFGGKDITNLDEAKSLFAELLSDTDSYFAFNNDRLGKFPRQPLISLSELLEFTLSRSVTKMDSNDELPNLQTRFETVSKSFVQVSGELEDFWKNCVWMLHEGCSGTDICNKFDYSSREVQESLYKLRVKGLIKPVRVFKPVNAGFKKSLIAKNLKKIANKNAPAAAVAIENDSFQNQLQKRVDNFEQAKKIQPPPMSPPVQAEPAVVFSNESIIPPTPVFPQPEVNPTTYAAPNIQAVEEVNPPPPPLLLSNETLITAQSKPIEVPVIASIKNNLQTGVSRQLPVEAQTKVETNYTTESYNPVDVYSENAQVKPAYESPAPQNHSLPQNNNRVGILRRMLNSLFR